MECMLLKYYMNVTILCDCEWKDDVAALGLADISPKGVWGHWMGDDRCRIEAAGRTAARVIQTNLQEALQTDQLQADLVGLMQLM